MLPLLLESSFWHIVVSSSPEPHRKTTVVKSPGTPLKSFSIKHGIMPRTSTIRKGAQGVAQLFRQTYLNTIHRLLKIIPHSVSIFSVGSPGTMPITIFDPSFCKLPPDIHQVFLRGFA